MSDFSVLFDNLFKKVSSLTDSVNKSASNHQITLQEIQTGLTDLGNAAETAQTIISDVAPVITTIAEIVK